MSTLGRMERVDLNEIWATEAQHFTPWLAREENLALLGETLGLELEHEATEKSVGPFRADILCKDINDGNWVLIENQLGRTDHTHLGQLLTYAAGLKTVTIIWIAASFTDEHRAALDWLNAITEEDFRFFALEVELWRIGQSPAAPKFNIVSKPNAWSKSVSRGRKQIDDADLTGVKADQLAYWTAFADHVRASSTLLRPQKPLPQHWTNMAVGRSGFLLGALVNSQRNRIGVELWISDEPSKAYFHLLHAQKEAIEAEFGGALDWRELQGSKTSKVEIWREDTDFRQEGRWPEQHAWLTATLEKFHTVFSDRVGRLNASDHDPQPELEPDPGSQDD